MNFGFLITAFENVEQTLQNIRHIRGFPRLDRSQICVVSTTENESVIDRFNNLLYTEGLQPLIIKVIKEAPGNSTNPWEPPKQDYISWRHKWLGPRILKSFDVGFNLLYESGVDVALHLHSDTFWKPDAETQLIEEIEHIKPNSYKCAGYWDLCIEDNGLGLHPHPEGQVLDIGFLKHMGILPFSDCYKDDNFVHWNWGSVESLIANWCHYKLTNRCLEEFEKPKQIFLNMFKVRMTRPYHGDWSHLVNLGGVQ